MKKFLILISILITLQGCAINSGVVPLTDSTFKITQQAATGFSGIEGVKDSVRQEANIYCRDQNKVVKIVSTDQTNPPYILGNFPKAEMTFTCETKR
jgi:hypothetical protein